MPTPLSQCCKAPFCNGTTGYDVCTKCGEVCDFLPSTPQGWIHIDLPDKLKSFIETAVSTALFFKAKELSEVFKSSRAAKYATVIFEENEYNVKPENERERKMVLAGWNAALSSVQEKIKQILLK